jgi:hypothetical protein
VGAETEQHGSRHEGGVGGYDGHYGHWEVALDNLMDTDGLEADCLLMLSLLEPS